jgi:hypothetical protein
MRRRAVLGLLLGVFACRAGPAFSQAILPKFGKETVIFIHCGPKQPNDPVVRAVAVALLQQGFLVREPETDQDKVGGPGVDYFDPMAAETAQQIAKFVNDVLARDPTVHPEKPLSARLQRASTPAFYFGVWLF